MEKFSRRQFARLGGAALVGAAALRSGIAFAADETSAPSAGSAAVSDRLAPIAPELRPAAMREIEMMAGRPTITAQNLRTIEMPPRPAVALLPDVPVAERQIPASGALPAVKVYVINSDPAKRRPGLLHIHGGGYVLGAAETSVRSLQDVAKTLDCTIVTVEYRLAPETSYAGSTEDNYAGLKWLHSRAGELGVDRTRIAIMGESAGGGHAALLAIRARDRGEIPLVLQVLVYPMLDDRTATTRPVPPHIATVGWNRAANRMGWESFLGQEPGTPTVPVAGVPARLQDLSGLAPAFIGVGGVDLFVDENIEYARRLNNAAVPTELLVVPGAFHAFDQLAPETKLSQAFTKAKLNALRRAFGREIEL